MATGWPPLLTPSGLSGAWWVERGAVEPLPSNVDAMRETSPGDRDIWNSPALEMLCLAISNLPPTPDKVIIMSSSNEPYKEVAYEPLGDSTARLLPPCHHWRSKLLHFGAGGLATLFLALAALAIQRVALAPPSTAEIEAEAWNHCGRSSAVARQRGCVMEPLFYGWMPPACVFPELTAAHPVFEDRPWYRDKNMTIALRPEELWAGAHTMIYTPR